MLWLDSEALSALAHPRTTPAREARVRALMHQARQLGEPVGTVAAVLAEVVRGRQADAAVFHVLKSKGLYVQVVDQPVAVQAGQTLGFIGEGSGMAVDAFLVAAADLDPARGVIATVDVGDISRLAAHLGKTGVVGIS